MARTAGTAGGQVTVRASRPRIVWLAAGLGMLGAGLAVLPFFASLEPGARARAQRPHVHVPELAPGRFAFVRHPVQEASDLLFVRREDGRLQVWEVPRWPGRRLGWREGLAMPDVVHGLPDLHWWRPWMPCVDFHPDFTAKEFRCFDVDANESVRSMRWSLDGRSAYRWADDMLASPGHASLGWYVLGAEDD